MDASVTRSAVEVVADDRVSGVRQVNPDLVGATGFRLEEEKRRVGGASDDPVERRRRSTVERHTHAPAVATVGPER
jgi:hypothetical protein